MPLTLTTLTSAVTDGGVTDLAAVRFTNTYQPAAGAGAKVYPPTYPRGQEEPPYVYEQRFDGDGNEVESVLLDSVASQANRVEQALLDAVDAGTVALPLLVIETAVHGRRVRLTSLEMPHRCSDAYLRDSATADDEPFDATEVGKRLRAAKLRDARTVYEVCPTALVLGTWDSHRGKPELSFKAPRVWVSELYGVAPQQGFRVGSRLDPLGMLGGRVKVGDGEGTSDWRLLEILGEETQETVRDERAPASRTQRLSEVGHGNVAPAVVTGGVAIRSAERRASLSLAGLRRLRFPVDGDGSPERDAAGRAVLAALAILGDRLAFGGADLSLRSGCDLVVESERVELVSRGAVTAGTEFSVDDSRNLLEAAVEQAAEHGLSWRTEPLLLKPRANLQEALEANLLRV